MRLLLRKVVCGAFHPPSWPIPLTDTCTELSMVPNLCLPSLDWDSQTKSERSERTESGDCNRMSSASKVSCRTILHTVGSQLIFVELIINDSGHPYRCRHVWKMICPFIDPDEAVCTLTSEDSCSVCESQRPDEF